jgi:hypothetical protein
MLPIGSDTEMVYVPVATKVELELNPSTLIVMLLGALLLIVPSIRPVVVFIERP